MQSIPSRLAMMADMKMFALLPWSDWLAVAIFLLCWIGYAWFATVWSKRWPSLIAIINHYATIGCGKARRAKCAWSTV